jgi:hypothetical protein
MQRRSQGTAQIKELVTITAWHRRPYVSLALWWRRAAAELTAGRRTGPNDLVGRSTQTLLTISNGKVDQNFTLYSVSRNGERPSACWARGRLPAGR